MCGKRRSSEGSCDLKLHSLARVHSPPPRAKSHRDRNAATHPHQQRHPASPHPEHRHQASHPSPLPHPHPHSPPSSPAPRPPSHPHPASCPPSCVQLSPLSPSSPLPPRAQLPAPSPLPIVLSSSVPAGAYSDHMPRHACSSSSRSSFGSTRGWSSVLSNLAARWQ